MREFNNLKNINIDELIKKAMNKEIYLVDSRLPDSYVGWKLKNDKYSGHLKGAIDFSYSWLVTDYDDLNNFENKTKEEVLKDCLNNKIKNKYTSVYIYDSNGTDSIKVAQYFLENEIRDINIFSLCDVEINENQFESYPNYKNIISPLELKNYLDKKETQTLLENTDYIIFDVSYGEENETSYKKLGHIDTAIHVNTDWFEPPEGGWMLDSDENLIKLAKKLGLTIKKGAIITGPEPMATTKFATILKYLGIKDVRILNGALDNWKNYGYDLTKESFYPIEVDNFLSDIPVNGDIIKSLEEVKLNVEKENFNIVDTRTIEEFTGLTPGHSYHNIAGTIKNSIFGNAGIKSTHSMYFYRNIDKTMRNGYELIEMLKSNNANFNNHLSFMCGAGWRAAEAYWYFSIMGFENISLFSDGWMSWSNAGYPIIKNKEI